MQCRSLGLKLKDIFAKINFELGYELFFELFKFAHKLLLLNFNEFISKEMNLYRDSMVGSVIQANGMVDFEDSLRMGVLSIGCWCPIQGSISKLPEGAGWFWVCCGCHKDPISDKIPTYLVPHFGDTKLQLLCGGMIKMA